MSGRALENQVEAKTLVVLYGIIQNQIDLASMLLVTAQMSISQNPEEKQKTFDDLERKSDSFVNSSLKILNQINESISALK